MHIIERIVKIVVTFFIFIVAQALLAASINTLFDLIPLRIDRFFANSLYDQLGNKSGSGKVDAQSQKMSNAKASCSSGHKQTNGNLDVDRLNNNLREKTKNAQIATKDIAQSFVDTAPLVVAS